MRKILMRVSTMLSAAALLVGLSVVSSCNDTKDDVKKEEVKELPNCFSVADTTINLVYGEQRFLESAGDESYGGNNDIYIELYSEDTTGLTGSSEIALDFCVDKAHTALVAGTYKYSAAQPYVAGTLTPDGSSYSIYLEDDVDIISGEAVVKLSGEIYEITFVGKDKLDKEVKAYYKGKLESY